MRVQPLLQKYFCFRLTRLKSISLAVLSPRGALAIVIDAGRDAVDAAASGAQVELQGGFWIEPDPLAIKRRADDRCSCVRQNRVVLAPVAGAKAAEACRPDRARIGRQFANDGDKTNSSPGRARRKPLKPLRAGTPGDPGTRGD